MKLHRILAVAVLGTISSISARADSVEVVLHLRENVNMEELAQAVNNPDSPRYLKFYNPEEIRDLAAPTAEEYQAVLDQLKAQGLEIVKESPTHLFLTVRGERHVLERMDQTAKRSFDSLDFSPAARMVASVNGLIPGPKRHHHLVVLHQDRAVGNLDADAAQAQFTGNTPATIRQLYGFNAIYAKGITGKGQHIAVATYNDFFLDDINQYYQKNNIKPGPQVDKVLFNGTPSMDMGSAAETQTDAEFAGMVAPAAQIHIFPSAENSNAGELQLFTAILDDNRSKIVNYSWGSCETYLDPGHKKDMESVFARAVAQGVNIFVASGDSGSDCQQDGSTVADYPAVNPNVVAVGGTTLADNNGDAAETAWSGSGGGISTNYTLPKYQGVLGHSYTMRSYPDVAFNADPNSGQPTWVHYDPNSDTPPADASYIIIGGTSIAAPQWAGFLALVQEARGVTFVKTKGATRAKSPLGFLNPILYRMAAGNQATYLHPVTSGSNGAYSAGPGWNAVTGWGSMRGASLYNYLKAL